MRGRRLGTVMAFALAFGVVAAAVSGQSGDGRTLVSQIRSQLGGLSAPWVLIAWWAGARGARVWRGAALGLLATLVALFGFYVVSGIVEAMGNGVMSSSFRWMAANHVWFEAGLVSGPVFGALGGWSSSRGASASPLVVGLVLVGEPLVLLASGAIFPNGVLSPLTGLPMVVRVVPGFGLAGASAVRIAVYAAELAIGLATIAYAAWSGRRGADRTSSIAA